MSFDTIFLSPRWKPLRDLRGRRRRLRWRSAPISDRERRAMFGIEGTRMGAMGFLLKQVFFHVYYISWFSQPPEPRL
jgi:hypothetical protein